MKRNIIAILISFIMIIINIGCANDKAIKQEELDVTKGLTKGEILVFSPFADFKIYNDISKQRQFYVDVISTEELEKEKLSVSLDAGVTYKYDIEKVPKEDLDVITYIEYIGKKEEIERLREKDASLYEEEIDKYKEELEKKSIRKVLHYKIYITITQIHVPTKINTISIKYKNVTHKVNVGNVEICNNAKMQNDEKGINMVTIASSEVKVQKNEDGIENYTDSEVFKTKNKIIIKDIRLLNSRKKIKKCSFMIENGEYFIEQEWKNRELEVLGNSKVGINVNLLNAKLKNNYQYQGNEYIIIEYEYKNKRYYMYWEVNFDSLLTGYELCVYLGKKS